MANNPRSIKPSGEEWETWTEAAVAAGLPRNTWIRRALNNAAQLERAIRNQEAAEAARPEDIKFGPQPDEGPVSRIFNRRNR